EAIARRLILLVQLIALQDLRQNSLHREIARIDDGVSRSNGGGMMCVASRSHGQAANLCVFESVAVIPPQGRGGVENLDGIDRQRFQSRKTDSGAEQIVRVWRNGQAASFMNHLADF